MFQPIPEAGSLAAAAARVPICALPCDCAAASSARHRRQDGSSSLKIAAQNGHADAVRVLLEGKASVDLQDKVGVGQRRAAVTGVVAGSALEGMPWTGMPWMTRASAARQTMCVGMSRTRAEGIP